MFFRRKEFLIIFVIQVTEVLGFSLILPFLPLYAQSLGASAQTIGLILTAFSFFQFLSAPIMGRLSDFYGRKPLLILSQTSTFLSFIILAFANSIPLIFLSRIVDGLLGSNMTIAQAYLSDISSKKDRTKAFGLSGAAFGFGFLIGPAIGGWLSQFSFALPALISAVISFATILTTHFLLPETVSPKPLHNFDFKIVNFDHFKKYFSTPASSLRLQNFFLFILSHVIWTSNFSLFASRRFGFTAGQIGLILAYIGAISIVIRLFVIPRLSTTYSNFQLLVIGYFSLFAGLLSLCFVSSGISLFLAFSISAFGSGCIRPVLLSSISQSASSANQGAVMGVANSLGSIAQIIGPALGGFLLTNYSPLSLLASAVSILAVAIALLLTNRLTFSQK